MDDQNDFPLSDSEENENHNTYTNPMDDLDDFPVSGSAEDEATSPLFPSEMHFDQSEAWNHFTMESGLDKRARCNYCGCLIKYDNGTSAMHSHVKRCKGKSDEDGNKRQKHALLSEAIALGVDSFSPLDDEFDQEVCQRALVRMIVISGLRLHIVESEAFCNFMSTLQPRFIVPSCITVVREILMLWDAEKAQLKNLLAEHCQRVCLTVDTWTSSQNLSYMSLVGHFVDNNWRLHKKILNFSQVTSHSVKAMAKIVDLCLNSWELNRVFSVTIDNVSTNDIGIQCLKKRLMPRNKLVLKGDYIHMHCFTHHLNLIVKEGLEEIDDSILRIRAAIRYIRCHPFALSKFEACIEQKKIEYEGIVYLDVETRWDSTYMMLEVALMYQKAFEKLELQDQEYKEELENGNGVPTHKDWDNVRLILPFLKIFHKAILRICGTSSVTSSIYMLEVFEVGRMIRQMCESSDKSVSLMAEGMRKKYNKYWGNPNDLHMLLLIAVVFDPRFKLGYVNWFIDQIFDPSEAANLKENIESCLELLFNEYNGPEGGFQSDLQEAKFDKACNDVYGRNQYLQSTRDESCIKSELEKFLEKDLESFNNLDVLNWWKLNSDQFPILANIAREVLAIPVSTVPSKSAFSIGQRLIDPYHSSLPPKLMEALVCTQDWLGGTPFSLFSKEDFEDLEQIELEMSSGQDAALFASMIHDG